MMARRVIAGRNKRLWTPRDITTSLWFDAADAATLTLNESAVAQWADKSGNARHVSSTGNQQPGYTATGLNGAGLITFDGSNDILATAEAGCNGITNCSMITVLRYITAVNKDIAIAINKASPGIGFGRYFYRSSTNQLFGTWNNDVSDSSISADIGGGHHIFGIVQVGLEVVICKDGTTDARTVPKTVYTVNSNYFSLGGTLDSFSYYSNISMAETLIFYSAIDPNTRQRIEGYLAHKWGLTANLPSDHPYKSRPPRV